MEQQGGATTASYAYGNALTRKDGETPLFDGQGSERTVTNAGGAVQATLTLSAFGQAVASSGSTASAYQYAATSRYRSDGDAGLSLVGCRYYDAQTGQFITRDTFLDQKPYAYCDGDPVNAVDPSGHRDILNDITDGLVAGAIVGLIATGVGAPIGIAIAVGVGAGAIAGGVNEGVQGGGPGDIVTGVAVGGTAGAVGAGGAARVVTAIIAKIAGGPVPEPEPWHPGSGGTYGPMPPDETTGPVSSGDFPPQSPN